MPKTIIDTRQLPLVMGVPQVADWLQISSDHLCRLLRAGEIPARKVGKRWLIPTENVLKYLGIEAERVQPFAPGCKRKDVS